MAFSSVVTDLSFWFINKVKGKNCSSRRWLHFSKRLSFFMYFSIHLWKSSYSKPKDMAIVNQFFLKYNINVFSCITTRIKYFFFHHYLHMQLPQTKSRTSCVDTGAAEMLKPLPGHVSAFWNGFPDFVRSFWLCRALYKSELLLLEPFAHSSTKTLE